MSNSNYLPADMASYPKRIFISAAVGTSNLRILYKLMTGYVSNFACLAPVVCQLWPSGWKILTNSAWPPCCYFTLYKHITLWISSQDQLPCIIFRNASMLYCVAPTLEVCVSFCYYWLH